MTIDQIIGSMTFPGVMLHELSHKLACNLFGVKVIEVKYFTIDSEDHLLGYVTHKKADRYYKTFFIDFAPFIICTLVSALMYLMAFNLLPSNLSKVFSWVAFSAAFWSFPSNVDADVLWQATKENIKYSVFVAFGTPFVVFIYALNFVNRFFYIGSFIWSMLIQSFMSMIFLYLKYKFA